jgi:hypothetical protein
MRKPFLFLLGLLVTLLLNPISSYAGVGKELLKISSKYGDDAIKLASKFKGAGKLFEKFGDDAYKIVKNYGDDGIKLLQTYGDDAIKFSQKYGEDSVFLINKYGEKAFKFASNYGDDGVKALMNYGDDALAIAQKYGDEGLKLLGKNAPICKALVKANIPTKAIAKIANFSDEGIKITSSLVKRITESAPGKLDDFLRFIEKFGEKGSRFVWKNVDNCLNIVGKNKFPAVLTALIVIGLANGEKVVAETSDVTKEVVKQIKEGAVSVVDVAANSAVEAGKEVVGKSNILLLSLALVIVLFGIGFLFKIGFFPAGKGKSSKSDADKEPPWA